MVVGAGKTAPDIANMVDAALTERERVSYEWGFFTILCLDVKPEIENMCTAIATVRATHGTTESKVWR